MMAEFLDFKATCKDHNPVETSLESTVSNGAAAQGKSVRFKPASAVDLCHDVLKEEGVHASCANGSLSLCLVKMVDGGTSRKCCTQAAYQEGSSCGQPP